MILKVFPKRTNEGESVETEFNDWLFEYPIIKWKRTAEGFQFLLEGRKNEKDHGVIVVTSTQGYEILNEQGVSIEKYNKPEINEEEDEKTSKGMKSSIQELIDAQNEERGKRDYVPPKVLKIEEEQRIIPIDTNQTSTKT